MKLIVNCSTNQHINFSGTHWVKGWVPPEHCDYMHTPSHTHRHLKSMVHLTLLLTALTTEPT